MQIEDGDPSLANENNELIEPPISQFPLIPALPDEFAEDDADADADADADVEDEPVSESGMGFEMPEPEGEEHEEMSTAAAAAESTAQPMVDATYRVRMPANQSPIHLGRATSTAAPAGTSNTFAATVEHLRMLSEDPTAGEFRVVIRRRGPPSFNGFKLPTCEIEEMDVMPFESVRDRVADLHGGGTYFLQVFTPSKQVSRSMLFSVDENVHEPKVPANAVPMNTLQSSSYGRMMRPQGNMGMQSLGVSMDADQVLVDLRRQELVAAATKQKEDREYEIEKGRRRRKLEDEAERETEERKKMLPEIAEANRRVETLKDEIRHMADSFKDSIRELANSKNRNGDDESVKLLIESMKMAGDQQQKQQQRQTELQVAQMKQQSDMMIALITNMNKEKPNDNSIIEAIKMSVESSKQTTQMIMDVSKNENSVMRDLFTSVVSQRLSAPDDQVKMHRDAEDRGWTKAMELSRMLEEARSGSDEGVDIDPEGGFWGNISNIALQGIARAVRGAGSGGGLRGALQNAFSPVSGYPQEQALPAPVHYQPQPQPQLQQPQMQQMQMQQQPQRQLPVVLNPTAVLPSSNPGIEASPLFEGVVNDDGASFVQQTLVTPAPVAAVAGQGTESEEDLRMHVTEAMRMALDDFKVGRKVHDWSDHAIDKWHRQFKITLAQAPDDAERIQIIGRMCESAVFEQVISRIRSGGPDVGCFTQAIQAVVQDVAREYAA